MHRNLLVATLALGVLVVGHVAWSRDGDGTDAWVERDDVAAPHANFIRLQWRSPRVIRSRCSEGTWRCCT